MLMLIAAPALLIVTTPDGIPIHRKAYPTMTACLRDKATVSGQAQTTLQSGFIVRDRNAPRAVCVPK